MRIITQRLRFFILTTIAYLFLGNCVFAVEQLPSQLISLNSKEGTRMLSKNATPNTIKLLSNFITQELPSYCGIASAVMVLNSSNISPPLDEGHKPYHYFNQTNFFYNPKIPNIINLEQIKYKGLTLAQLSDALKSYGLKTTVVYANTIDLAKFRTLMKNALHNNDFVIVDFFRGAINQQGRGHHSPIAAYDKTADRFLLLDVARYKYPPYWIKTQDLWKAVSYDEDKDKQENQEPNKSEQHFFRGLIIISHG